MIATHSGEHVFHSVPPAAETNPLACPAWNRGRELTVKTNDQSLPWCTGSNPPGSFTCDDPGVPDSKSRLTQVANSVSETNYLAYHPLGRVLSGNQATNAQTYGFVYSYNLAGRLERVTYPSGRIVSYGFDDAGRIAFAVPGTDLQSPDKYADQIQYFPHGALSPAITRAGGSVTQTFLYDRVNRLGSASSTAGWSQTYR